MTADEWTVVTVSYNSAHHLEQWGQNRRVAPFVWMVVDNASRDSSTAVAERHGAAVVALDRNVGFARANNIALARVETRYVIFVNPDVRIEGPDSFDVMEQSLAARPRLVAPQLLNMDGTEQPNGRGLPFLVDKFAHRGIRLPGSQPEAYLLRSSATAPFPVAWAIGAAVGGETSTVRAVGGWDERYFLYYEDHELGLRARDRGVEVVVEPRARWPHEWQRATKGLAIRPWAHEARSAARFYSSFPGLLLATPARRKTLLVRWGVEK